MNERLNPNPKEERQEEDYQEATASVTRRGFLAGGAAAVTGVVGLGGSEAEARSSLRPEDIQVGDGVEELVGVSLWQIAARIERALMFRGVDTINFQATFNLGESGKGVIAVIQFGGREYRLPEFTRTRLVFGEDTFDSEGFEGFVIEVLLGQQ